MKIKHWLVISYVVVMVLPLLALYALYSLISSYDQERDLLEHLEVLQTVHEMAGVLEDPGHYTLQSQDRYAAVEALTSSSLGIRLYRYDGILLYSSLDQGTGRLTRLDASQLYRDVNRVQKNLTTYTVKHPVLQKGGELAGFYEVTLRRDVWLSGVQERTVLIAASLAAFLLLLFGGAYALLHRKLNLPLLKLQRQMDAFAEGRRLVSERPRGDEIGELQRRFEAMQDKIEQSQQAVRKQQREKETMLAALSHDLKTPLAAIQAYAERLLSDDTLTAEERADYRAVVGDKLRHMKKMIDDLSLYAALQADRYRLKPVEADGEELFEMLLSSYDEPSVRKGIRLTVDQRVDGSSYDVDVTQMMRVMDNLVSNAIRHTPPGGQILLSACAASQPLPEALWSVYRAEVETWRAGSTVILVQNEGEGIPEALRQQIFEPFVQGEASRTMGGSSGLGLSIAKLLVERHGGAIRLWSDESRGTLIACRLPERKGDDTL